MLPGVHAIKAAFPEGSYDFLQLVQGLLLGGAGASMSVLQFHFMNTIGRALGVLQEDVGGDSLPDATAGPVSGRGF